MSRPARPEAGQSHPQPPQDPQPEEAPYRSPSLDAIIKYRLKTLADQVPASLTPESNAPRADTRLLSDIGEFLILSARMWADLSEELVKNRPIERAVKQAHEASVMRSRFTDLSGVNALMQEERKLLYAFHHQSLSRMTCGARKITDECVQTDSRPHPPILRRRQADMGR